MAAGIQAGDARALFDDHTGAEETDPGGHLCGHPGGVAGAERVGAHQDEQRGAEADERIGAQPGHLRAPLPLQSDGRAEANARGDPQRKVQGVDHRC